MADEKMLVVATGAGFKDGIAWEIGQQFYVDVGQTASWFEPVDPKFKGPKVTSRKGGKNPEGAPSRVISKHDGTPSVLDTNSDKDDTTGDGKVDEKDEIADTSQEGKNALSGGAAPAGNANDKKGADLA